MKHRQCVAYWHLTDVDCLRMSASRRQSFRQIGFLTAAATAFAEREAMSASQHPRCGVGRERDRALACLLDVVHRAAEQMEKPRRGILESLPCVSSRNKPAADARRVSRL